MRAALTPTQARVLAYIVAHQETHQRPPTRLEIARHFEWSSQNAASDHVKALHRKGAIAMESSSVGGQRNRYIRVLGVSAKEAPTQGCAAGTPQALPGERAPSTPAA